MSTYKFVYGVSRVDSDSNEVAEEASLTFSPATAEGPFMDEDRYQVTHTIKAKDDEGAIAQMREIIDASPLDIDIFSLYDESGATILTEEDDEE